MTVADQLRAAGLRVTRPRIEVAATLRLLGGHRTADEVYARLPVALPRASVYNALAAMADAGIVLRAAVGPGAAVYEIAQGRHHHFVCRRCGGITDVPCVVGESPCLSPGDGFGDVEVAQVIFRGVCDRCLAAGGAED